MEYENLIYEKQGQVAVITLNRPKALNALNDGAFKGISGCG